MVLYHELRGLRKLTSMPLKRRQERQGTGERKKKKPYDDTEENECIYLGLVLVMVSGSYKK